MQGEIIQVTTETLLPEVQKMYDGDWRAITATATDLPDDVVDILYHFDKNLEVKHLRLQVKKGAIIPSTSGIYFCNLVIENEIADFFGVKFSDLLLDYEGKFMILGWDEIHKENVVYRADLSTPAARIEIIDKSGEGKGGTN